jgi:splicing factor 3B subunit 4
VGGLDDQVNESLLWELFLQAGPVGTCCAIASASVRVDEWCGGMSVNVFMPKDRVTSTHQSYGFVEFQSEDDADYAIKVMNMIRLFGKPIRVNKVLCLPVCLSACM